MAHISLSQIYTAEPCTMAWDELHGTDTKRYCKACNKHVHDLSKLTRIEGEKLINELPNLCAIFNADQNGAPIPLDYELRKERKRVWPWIVLTSLAAGVASVVMLHMRGKPTTVVVPRYPGGIGIRNVALGKVASTPTVLTSVSNDGSRATLEDCEETK